jgi:hypothetical protein
MGKMNQKLIISGLLMQAFILFAGMSQAKDMVDVITLKNDAGIIKGIISNQIPGKTMTIHVSGACIKFDADTIATIITDQVDSSGMKKDVITLKNGNRIVGSISGKSPGKWVEISTKGIGDLTYSFEDIEKIGKETRLPGDDLFKTYGLLETVSLKNGNGTYKGIIIEQSLDKYLKIETVANGIVVIDFADVKSVCREGYDNSKDMFTQSAFLDVVNLKNKSSIRGIITCQEPGKEVRIMAYGNSLFVQNLSDIESFSKELNPYKIADSLPIKILEPEYIGECFAIKDSAQNIPVEKQEYIPGAYTHSLYLLKGASKSTTRFTQNGKITLRVRVGNNNLDPKELIHIFKIGYNKKTQRRIVNSMEHIFLSINANRESKPVYIHFDAVKAGENCFDITFHIGQPGEYAIHVDGCKKSFSLFGVDSITIPANGKTGHRKR